MGKGLVKEPRAGCRRESHASVTLASHLGALPFPASCASPSDIKIWTYIPNTETAGPKE